MARIAFIGAGSFGFTRKVVRDILTFPELADSTIALMDINEERLGLITKAIQKIVDAGGYPAQVVSTTDRAEALDGADGVVITILAWLTLGRCLAWRLVHSSVEAPGEVQAIFAEVGSTCSCRGEVRVSRLLDQPVALGLIRPLILLPESLCRPEESLACRAALAHEIEHIRRGDLVTLALCRWLTP